MSLIPSTSFDKVAFELSSEEPGLDIAGQAAVLEEFVRQAAADGQALHEVERCVFDRLLRLGHTTMDLFLSLQGDGDLGEEVRTEQEQTLVRSEEPARRELRTVFGKHEFEQYVYSAGPKQKIDLRPLDARMHLSPGIDSCLFEEFSQFFCVEQAFGLSREGLKTVLRQNVCEDHLQAINHRVGRQAEEYLEDLPLPPPDEEASILVLTGDGKGVPLVKTDAARVPVTGEAPARPGNRRMATLAGVYSVAPYDRTADHVLAALFRDTDRPKKNERPKPKFKEIRACFPRRYDDGDGSWIETTGALEAFTWAASRIEARRLSDQTLVRLLDGQVSLRETSDACLPEDIPVVDILDIIHVAGYVKRAAAVFHTHEEHREAFSRDTLEKILTGQTKSVIHSLKIKASLHGLKGKRKSQIATVCGYFENNLDRMRYDEYLSEGYPIATGVIEGACRHLVKDRMERTGMRWRLNHAEAMLNVRAVFQSSHWDAFHSTRITREYQTNHPHHALITDYKPIKA